MADETTAGTPTSPPKVHTGSESHDDEETAVNINGVSSSSTDKNPKISDIDMFLLLNVCQQSRTNDWNPILECLQYLRQEENLRLIPKTLTRRESRNGTPIHAALTMKAPISVVQAMLSIVPENLVQSLLQIQDDNGNTPLHLACQQFQHFAASNHNNLGIDMTILEILTAGAPAAHSIWNQSNEFPLSLLLESPLLCNNQNNTTTTTTTLDDTSLSSVATFIKFILSNLSHLVVQQDPSTGMTILHKAAANHVKEPILLALLESAESQTSLKTPDKAGRLPLHYIAATVPTSSNNNNDNNNNNSNIIPTTFASWILEIYPTAVVHPSTSGDTPLHILINNLCKKQKDKKDQKNDHDTNSIGQWQNTSVETLLKTLTGPDVEALCPLFVKNRDSLTPLHACALLNAPPTVARIIMENSSLAKQAATIGDLNKATPLHLLCGSSHIGGMMELIEILGTAEAAMIQDRKDRTPLHVAAENKKSTKAIIKALLDLNPNAAKVESAKNHNRMPFHLALKKKADESIIKALLRAYPDALKAVFDGNNTLFHEMCQQKTPFSTVQGLLPIYPEGVKIPNEHGNLPLHLATAHQCSLEVIQAFVEAYPEACMIKNKHKDLPLHYAAVYPKSSEVVQFLVAKNPTAIAEVNENGMNPLQMAQSSKMDESVIDLMKKMAPAETSTNSTTETANGTISNAKARDGYESSKSKKHERRSSRHATLPTTQQTSVEDSSPKTKDKEKVISTIEEPKSPSKEKNNKNDDNDPPKSKKHERSSSRHAIQHQEEEQGAEKAPTKKVSIEKAPTDEASKGVVVDQKTKRHERRAARHAAAAAALKQASGETTEKKFDAKDERETHKDSEVDPKPKRQERRAARQLQQQQSQQSTSQSPSGKERRVSVAAIQELLPSTKDKEEHKTKEKDENKTEETEENQSKDKDESHKSSKKHARRLLRAVGTPKETTQGNTVAAIHEMLPKKEKFNSSSDAKLNSSLGSLRQEDLDHIEKAFGAKADGSSGSLDLDDLQKSNTQNDSKSGSRRKLRSRSRDRKGDSLSKALHNSANSDSAAERRRERRALRKEENGDRPHRRGSKDAEAMGSSDLGLTSKVRRARSSDRNSRSSAGRSSSNDAPVRRASSSDRARFDDPERRSRSQDRVRSKSKDRTRSKSASRRHRRRESRTDVTATPKRRAASATNLLIATVSARNAHNSFSLPLSGGDIGELPLHTEAPFKASSKSRDHDIGAPSTPTGGRRRKITATTAAGITSSAPSSPGTLGSKTPTRRARRGVPRVPTTAASAATTTTVAPGRSASSEMVAELVAEDLHASSRLFLPPTATTSNNNK